MESLKGQLTLRGIVIGCIGCIIITIASVYIALKMGALPWPIVFAAIISLFFLRALNHGKASLNEANVTHTIMSAGAMVAGGLVFTIPGIWMLGLADNTNPFQTLGVALAGVLLGLVCTALLRKHFIEEAGLEYPIGEAAAQTLKAGNVGGSVGKKLFGAMGFAGIYTALRDLFGVLPGMLFSQVSIPGVAFGIYNSPMMVAVGFLVGTGAVCVWFAGALVANFGIIVGGPALGLCDLTTAKGIVSSLGMGLMMGAGLGVIVKNIIPKAFELVRKRSSSSGEASRETTNTKHDGTSHGTASSTSSSSQEVSTFSSRLASVTPGLCGLSIAAVALIGCFVLGFDPLSCIVVVLLGFVACAMSAQSVGQTGIDPMEIFGLIVLLAVAALSSVPEVQLFFVAGVVAVACGLAGDVMNDFHAGHVLGTSPHAQLAGQAIGAVVGAVVAAVSMAVLLGAYGPESFGPDALFVSAQASVVATMVSGIPHAGAFALGLIAGLVLHCVNFPAMMFGLGVYLPFYMSFTSFLGCMVKVVFDAIYRMRTRKAPQTSNSLDSDVEESDTKAHAKDAQDAYNETGLVISSGLLGGESIVGVVSALLVLAMGVA